MPPRPTVVIGLDGATWRLLDKWIDEGELPILEEIRTKSTWAVQKSCLPPVTSPNWKCYSTGKNPGKLGVYWWEIIDVEAKDIHIPDATDYNSAELFDYFDDNGRSWAAVNMPTTFPPHGGDGKGIMVSGGNVARGKAYTSPRDYQEELENRFDYKIAPERDIHDQGAIDEIIELVDSRFNVGQSLLVERDLDFLHITVFLCNKLQHYFWDDDRTLRVWKCIDRNLEWFVDRDIDLVFMSDHGSNEITSQFQLNVWLESEGYLVREKGKKNRDRVASRVGLTQRGLSTLANQFGVRSLARRLVPDNVIEHLPKRGYKKENKLAPLNWDETVAVASGQGLVYLTEPNAQEADKLRREIADKLAALEDPISGGPIAKEVYVRDDVYSGPCKYAPDVVFDQSPGIHTEDMIGEYELFDKPSDWCGENERDGIFMAYGESFASEGKIEPTRIIDLAPTLLHLHGLPIPEDVDGRPLPIFADGLEPARRDPEFRSPLSSPWGDDNTDRNHDSDEVEQQLRDLGYLN